MSLHTLLKTSANLQHQGPTVEIEVGLPGIILHQPKATRLFRPPFIGNALIDTGAAICAIEERLLKQLGVKPEDRQIVKMASGDWLCNFYRVRLSFPGSKLAAFERRVIGFEFRTDPIIGLIGRDVLSYLLLIYNGPTGAYTVAS